MAVQPLDLTPEQQKAYDDMRAQPGILFDAAGNVVFDGEAEATGATPFKTRAEVDAQAAALEAALDEYGRKRDEADAAAAAEAAQPPKE
jgi:hypothetical protein